MKHFYDSSTNITRSEADFIISRLQAQENVTTLWLPGSGRTALISQLNKLHKSTNPDKSYKKLQILHLDLSLNMYFFEKQLREVLELHAPSGGIRKMIKSIIDQGYQIVFALDNFDFSDVELLKYIYSFKNIDQQNICFLILALQKDYLAGDNLREKDTLMSHNIIIIKYLNLAESAEWLTFNAKQHNVSLSAAQIELITKFCGGVPALMRCVLRRLSAGESAQQVLAGSELQSVASTLWNHYSPREQHLIKSVLIGAKLPPYTKEIEYLKQHNFLNADNTFDRDNWLGMVVKQQTSFALKLSGEQILWDGISVEEAFTTKEQLILRTLLSSQQIISRPEMAQIIWGDNATGKYSDWAIDQAISRIRKKLNKLGADGSALESIKKKGFVIRKS